MRRKTTPLVPNLRPELHHWWPKGVSAFWADADGKTTRETPDGNISQQRPENLGAIKNAHHVDLKGPWSHSFERHFDAADSYFPQLITELLQLSSITCHSSDYRARFREVRLSDESANLLPECLASLAVRSPRFKKIVWQMILKFGSYSETTSERDVIFSSNIGHCYPAMIESLRRCHLYFILYSDTLEFSFADGFYHNLWSSGDPISHARMLVPLTPCMAVAAVASHGRTSPTVRTLRLNNAEIQEINYIIQLYSIDCIFYRETRPEIDPQYFNGQFMSLKGSRWPLIDKFAEPFVKKDTLRNLEV